MLAALRSRKLLGAIAACAAAATMMGAGTLDDHNAKPKAEIGKKAPDFALADHQGREHRLSDYIKEGKIVVLEWFNPDCPFVVKHYREDTQTMNKIQREFAEHNVVWLRINTSAPGLQGYGKERNERAVREWNIEGPILFDTNGHVGRLFDAKRTPEMYVIDADGILRYHGAICNDRSARSIGETIYLKNALRQVVNGETVTTPKTDAYGCTVKYPIARAGR